MERVEGTVLCMLVAVVVGDHLGVRTIRQIGM